MPERGGSKTEPVQTTRKCPNGRKCNIPRCTFKHPPGRALDVEKNRKKNARAKSSMVTKGPQDNQSSRKVRIVEPHDETPDSSVLLQNSDEKSSDSFDQSTTEPKIEKVENKFLNTTRSTESNLFRVASYDKWGVSEIDRHEKEMEEARQRLIFAHNAAMDENSSSESDNVTSGQIDPPSNSHSQDYRQISTTEYSQLKSLLKTLQADIQRLRTHQTHSSHSHSHSHSNKKVTKETAQPYMDHGRAAEGEAGETEHLTARNTSSNRRAGDSRSQKSGKESSRHRRRKTRDSHKDHHHHHDYRDRRHRRRDRKKRERSRRRRRRPEHGHYRGDGHHHYRDSHNYREFGGGNLPYDGGKYNPYHPPIPPFDHAQFQPPPPMSPLPPHMYDPYASYYAQQYYPSHSAPPAPIMHYIASPAAPLPPPPVPHFTPSASVSGYPAPPAPPAPPASTYSSNAPYHSNAPHVHHERPTINVNYVYPSDPLDPRDVRRKRGGERTRHDRHNFDKPIRPKRRGRSDGHNLNLNRINAPSPKGSRRVQSVGFDSKRLPDLRNIPEEEERPYSEEREHFQNQQQYSKKQPNKSSDSKPKRRHARTTSKVPAGFSANNVMGGSSHRPPVNRVVSNMPDRRNEYEEKPRRVAFDDESYHNNNNNVGGDVVPPPPSHRAPTNPRHYERTHHYNESHERRTTNESHDRYQHRNHYEASFEGSNYSYET